MGRETTDRTAARLVWLTWAMIIVPRLLQSLTAPKHRTTTRSQSEGYSTIASLADTGLTFLVIGFCLLAIINVLKRGAMRPSPALLIFLTPWVTLALRDLYLGTKPDVTAFLYPLLGITIALLRPKIQALKHLGYATGVTAGISILLGFLMPAAGIYRSVGGELISPDKQILPWGILVGPVTSGNNLAQFLLLGAPAVLLIPKRATRFLILGLVTFAVVWTSSRSSLIALVLFILIWIALQIPGRMTKALVAITMMLATGLTTALLPVVTHDPLAFTNRGYIWDVSLRMWQNSPLIGNGSSWYGFISKYQTELGGYAFHAHNEAVQTLVTGGILLAVALSVTLLTAILFAARDAAGGQLSTTLFLCVFFATCWFEVSLPIVDRLLLVPVVVVPLAFGFFREPAEKPQPELILTPPVNSPATNP